MNTERDDREQIEAIRKMMAEKEEETDVQRTWWILPGKCRQCY